MNEEKRILIVDDKEPVRSTGMVLARRKPSSAGLLTMMAALAWGGAGIGLSRAGGWVGTPPPPSKHDEERLRLAVERRKRRAEKKAENMRRTEAGKRQNAGTHPLRAGDEQPKH